MKRFFVVVMMCLALMMGVTSCKKGEKLPPAGEKGTISIEKFEGFEHGKGLAGDLLLSVSNGLGSNVKLTRGEISLNYGDSKICALELTGEVDVPKRVVSSVRVPVALNLSSPIVAYGIWSKILRGEIEKITVTIDADAKGGIFNKHIREENIPLREVLQKMGISLDAIKALVK